MSRRAFTRASATALSGLRSTRLPRSGCSNGRQWQVAASPTVRSFITDSTKGRTHNNTDSEEKAPKIVRGKSKVFKDADEAVADLKSGSTILSAGFGLCGTAGELFALQLDIER